MSTQSSVLLPPGGERIMVIMAHPDDAEFICGGTIACLAAEGCAIHYVLVTSGNRGSHDAAMTMERLAEIREEEQRHAASVLGVQEVTFLGHNYGEVEVMNPMPDGRGLQMSLDRNCDYSAVSQDPQ